MKYLYEVIYNKTVVTGNLSAASDKEAMQRVYLDMKLGNLLLLQSQDGKVLFNKEK